MIHVSGIPVIASDCIPADELWFVTPPRWDFENIRWVRHGNYYRREIKYKPAQIVLKLQNIGTGDKP